jgi:hypothetical protein
MRRLLLLLLLLLLLVVVVVVVEGRGSLGRKVAGGVGIDEGGAEEEVVSKVPRKSAR